MWQQRGPVAWALYPLALIFGGLVALRRWLYRRGYLASGGVAVPVIVVGNAVAGGAGKTPAVMAIAQHLKAAGFHPGVVSRGYGRSHHDCREVLPGSLSSEVGDEPLLIRHRCEVPVFVAPRRLDAAIALLARHPTVQVLICDDGLQHYALRRDIEIGLLDERGIGNGWMLPAGPLREPWPRAVDLLLLTSGQISAPQEFVQNSAPHRGHDIGSLAYGASRTLATHAHRADGSSVALTELTGRPLVALAGIARPAAFFAMLREQGLTLAAELALPDHHDFAQGLDPMLANHELLCTEKDAVKLWRYHPRALAVPLVFTPAPPFLAALDLALAQAMKHHSKRPR